MFRSVRSKPTSFSGWRECVKQTWLRSATEASHRLTTQGSNLWKVRKKRWRHLGIFIIFFSPRQQQQQQNYLLTITNFILFLIGVASLSCNSSMYFCIRRLQDTHDIDRLLNPQTHHRKKIQPQIFDASFDCFDFAAEICH